ncbi:MAG: ATP-binding cassette domain-containing protein [Chitinophagaceae bacterium]|nr:ATP-binding cassette domain-containing protein [Chitinophagaceae bacterium]
MTTISLYNAGKRYFQEWIFRHLNYTFESGKSYAITGPNGSGKSTLLQVIAGAMELSEGKLNYMENHTVLPAEKIYTRISYCAPYLELVEEMTLAEFLQFHHTCKPFLPGLTITQIMEACELTKAARKPIRYFSSGMKQRVKLAQAVFSDTAAVFLDEPCTNLDKEGLEWYHALVRNYCMNRIIIISSNDEAEYAFCQYEIAMASLKP